MPITYALTAVPHGPFAAAYSHPRGAGPDVRYGLRARGIVPMAYADTAGAAAYVADGPDRAPARIAASSTA